MKNIALIVASVALLAAAPGFAQSTLTCSSDDMRRHYCSADTRGGVQLLRQRSDAACREGYSWGYDRRGIWVDHGCRADFALGTRGRFGPGRQEGGYGGGYSGQASETITCSSDDMRRHYCAADTGGGVQLLRQRSDAACVQGSTWGYDRRGIWVDRGCRADFATGTGRGGGGFGREGRGGGFGQSSQTITCSSDDMRRHYCSANTRGGVQLLRQRSDAACRQGYSWGFDRRGIWVDHGCRADFLVR